MLLRDIILQSTKLNEWQFGHVVTDWGSRGKNGQIKGFLWRIRTLQRIYCKKTLRSDVVRWFYADDDDMTNVDIILF